MTFFFLSGLSGLIYEIVWLKMLTLVIGSTVFSATTVLTAFMGGLALGSFVAGRMMDRIKDPAFLYGLLEGGIGIYALILPFLIYGSEPLFRFIYQNYETSFYIFGFLRFLVCGTILLIPATMMGATLPILSKYFVDRQTHLGWTVGKLYGINTFGAVIGALAAGFVLIPQIGMSWTLYTAAMLNLSIAVAVLLFLRTPSISVSTKNTKKSAKVKSPTAMETLSPLTSALVMVSIGLSGIAAMIYQIAWTRVLTLFIGSSVYAFSLIVTAFICGLGLGSMILARFIDRRKNLILGFAFVQGIIGLSALLMVPILGRLPMVIAELVLRFFNSFEYLHLAEFVIIFLLMIIPTFMMGAAFPMATKICSTNIKRVGQLVGNVYAVNTLGAIIGSVCTGFLLVPWLGTQNSIFIAVALNLVAAVLVLLRVPNFSVSRRGTLALTMMMILTAGWWLIPSWDAITFTSGPYYYAEIYRELSSKKNLGLRNAMREGRQMLYFQEGINAAVSIEQNADRDLTMKINGKTQATARGDSKTQLMLGHLPLLLHPQAEDVLIIGLGSGMTLGAVERYQVKRIDVVEMEPMVVEAAMGFFQPYTNDALSDPRANLINADGRNHLALSDQQYDIIISQPSNLWIAGVANLFTRECFDLARSRLRQGGLICQWVQAYAMSSEDFKSAIHTFQSVFPHTSVWEASFGDDYLLIGAMNDLTIDFDRLAANLNRVELQKDWNRLQIQTMPLFTSKLLLMDITVAQYSAGASLHTDDNARLAYSTPKAYLNVRSPNLFVDLYQHQSSPADIISALGWEEIGLSFEKNLQQIYQAKHHLMAGYVHFVQSKEQDAIDRLAQALQVNPGDYDATNLLAKLYYEIGDRAQVTQRPTEAQTFYNASADVIENFIDSDQTMLDQQFELDVLYARVHLHLGGMAAKEGDPERALILFQKSLAGGVQLVEAYNNMGTVYEGKGQYDEAREAYLQAVKINRNYDVALINLGNVSLKQGRYDDAIDVYLQAQQLRPDYEMAPYNLGIAYFQLKQWGKAADALEHALALKADFPEAQRALDVVKNKLNETKEE